MTGWAGTIDALLSDLGRVMHIAMLSRPVYSLLCRVIAPTMYKLSSKTLGEFLDEFIKSPFLKQLIAIQWGYYGLSPCEDLVDTLSAWLGRLP